MRSRYFKTSKTQKPAFKWVGEPVTPPPVTAKERKLDPSGYLHYKSFQLGGLEVSVGDFILIRSESNSDSLLECDVARLDKLYQDFDNKADPYRAVVSWLCRPLFMPKQLMSGGHGFEEQGAPPLHDKFEVVGEAREFDRDISAESVYFKCRVMTGKISEDPVAFNKKIKKESYPCYLLRFDMKNSKTKHSRKKAFYLDPIIDVSSKSQQKLKGNSMKETKTPLSEVKLIKIKRKLSSSDVSESPAKRTKSNSGSKDTSPKLNNFVVKTPVSAEGNGLDGGYWGVEAGSKRTPKPKVPLEHDDPNPGRVRRRSSASVPATPLRTVVSTEKFTKVETATGSGRKITIKCGEDKKRFAPSSGLASSQITSILDSDEDDNLISPSKKVCEKTGPPVRVRRASVSCTTPTRIKITTVTPSKTKSPLVKRPASEIKRGSSFRHQAEDSDDDFIPKKKSLKKDGKRKLVSPSSSSESEDSDSDLEVLPASKSKKVQKTPQKTQGPKTPKRVFNPSVAPRAKPLSGDVDPLTEAQQRLHVSAVPDSLPCREEEFAEIFGYVESKLKEGTGGCYYISGVPGTGKTATVMEVIRYLQDNQEEFPEFSFYQLNGMRLTSPEQAYVEMWRQMTGEKATPEHAMKLLDARFNKSAPKRQSTVFLVDELDMLCNRKQSVLYNMFDWPSKPQGKLIIIAIANTMDLPERVMINRVSSRLGLTRQTFQPYTHTQLQAIVASRLSGLQVFQQDAIQLVARKVASLSGDARRALDICRRATEMAEVAGQDKIGVQHVTKAHQEMFSSPKILAIRSCSEYEQLLLRVMVAEFHRTGVEETTVGAVFRELVTSLRTEGLEVISLPAACSMVARLSAQRLVLAEHLRQGLETKLRLNVASEDINFALKKDDD